MADGTGTAELRPYFEDVQAHYDLSDEFFGLFQDPSRTYSCAYYERDDMTLEQAQMAKIDLALNQLDLQPRMTLLDIGCGWGALMKRAVERYDVNVIGLTLSKNQYAFCQQLLDQIDTERNHLVCLKGWEQFDDPVDRIVSIEAFEAFGKSRYKAFFDTTYRVLPADGRMVIETIFTHPINYWREHGIPVTLSDMKFTRFIYKEIFPGGQLPSDDDMRDFAGAAGFQTTDVTVMNPHYVRTLDTWAENLAAQRDAAIATTSEEVYDRYMHYLTGCADFFRRGISEVAQFAYSKTT